MIEHETAQESSSQITRTLLVLVTLTVVAAITRFFGISDWAFEGDELFTYHRSHGRASSLNNPAYYGLVVLSFKVFGMNEFAARFPAALLGTIAVPVFYFTWRHILGRYGALVGSVLIILSSWHLWHSQNARFYAGVFLFSSLSFYFYYQSLRKDKLSYLAWAIVSAIISFLFHASAGMVMGVCSVFSLLVFLFPSTVGRNLSRGTAKVHLILSAVCIVAALPFLWSLGIQWGSSGQTWGYSLFTLAIQVAKYVQLPIVACATVGVALLLRTSFPQGLLFLLGIVLPGVALFFGSMLFSVRPDYIFYSMPLILGAAGYFISRIRLNSLARPVGIALCTGVLTVTLLPEFASHYTGRKTHDIRRVASFMEKSYKPGDRILATVSEFNHYSNGYDSSFEKYVASVYGDSAKWKERLTKYETDDRRLWIILPIRRKPLARGLSRWLAKHAQLKWRHYSTRYDYTVKGYEVYLVER